ncbi:unnamed protein product [Schistocephalus solidus]|uniref:Uncharacterized protein n=1 Tax=Schistocephalus solidus TaxID=70667 RepID=A0A183TGB4_SCHSO|nr:unnamed protein product [Schistocephalus solidus]
MDSQSESHLGDDEAVICPTIGIADRLGYQHILSISPPDENIVQQMPAPRPRVHPRGLHPRPKAEESVGQKETVFSTRAQKKEAWEFAWAAYGVAVSPTVGLFERGRWEVRESDIPGVEAHTTPETLTWFNPPVLMVARGVAAGKNPTSRSHRKHKRTGGHVIMVYEWVERVHIQLRGRPTTGSPNLRTHPIKVANLALSGSHVTPNHSRPD